jgi:hypothetical protein
MALMRSTATAQVSGYSTSAASHRFTVEEPAEAKEEHFEALARVVVLCSYSRHAGEA